MRGRGNVRELRNLIERSLILGGFPDDFRGQRTGAVTAPSGTLEEVERRHILAVLEETGGDREETARRLGILAQDHRPQNSCRGMLEAETQEPVLRRGRSIRYRPPCHRASADARHPAAAAGRHHGALGDEVRCAPDIEGQCGPDHRAPVSRADTGEYRRASLGADRFGRLPGGGDARRRGRTGGLSGGKIARASASISSFSCAGMAWRRSRWGLRGKGRLRTDWPVLDAALTGEPKTAIDIFSQQELAAISPELAARAKLELVSTPNAVATDRASETRGMVVHSASPASLPNGSDAALVGGVLLNQNLVFIDTINDLVYRTASLPEGSQGTATALPRRRPYQHQCPAVRGQAGRLAPGSRRPCARRCWTRGASGSTAPSSSTTGTCPPMSRSATASASGSACLYVGFLEAPFGPRQDGKPLSASSSPSFWSRPPACRSSCAGRGRFSSRWNA